MNFDNSTCLYCQHTTDNLMIKICDLGVSTLFLFREQTYRGRCLVAYKDHVNEFHDLPRDEMHALMDDVARVTKAMKTALNAEKINIGAYADKLAHVHFHLVPKYVDGPDYGGTFTMNPQKTYLTDEEYIKLIDALKANL